MGTIGAVHNNGRGLAGVMNINRGSLYGYNYSPTRYGESALADILAGLAWNVTNGAKVVNFSLGYNGEDELNPNDRVHALYAMNYSTSMRRLLEMGYDFVVVQSAGNSARDARQNSFFFLITDDELRQRIIGVGAMDESGNIADFSNHGAMVDVLAPGVRIYSTVARSNSAYEDRFVDDDGNTQYWSGTSMAAPHVTGVVGLVWAINPGLSGAQVKDIIVDSANGCGIPIIDSREEIPSRTYFSVNAKCAVDMAIGREPELTTGRLAGQVIAATSSGSDGNPISGALVTLYSGINNSPLDVAITDECSPDDIRNCGFYALYDIPTGQYVLQIAADGYMSETFTIQIEAGVTTHIHRLRAVPDSDANGTVGGSVINAFTGRPITDEITLEFRRGIDMPGDIIHRLTTSNGSYIAFLPAGNYTVTASGDGYITTRSYVYSYPGFSLNRQDVVVSPAFSGGQSSVRIVLTWGELPYDLDSHLVGPAPDGGRFHTYYSNKTHYFNGERYADLDVDDTSSYGPETTTIYKLADGVYNFYVQDYSHLESTTSDYLRNSQAVVRIYSSTNELLRTFNVPTSGGASTIWHVFSLSTQGEQYSIVPVNTMHNVPTSPSSVGSNATITSYDDSISILSTPVMLTIEEIEAKKAAEEEAEIVLEPAA